MDEQKTLVQVSHDYEPFHLQKYHEAIRAFDKVLKSHPHNNQAREQMNLAQKKIMELGRFSLSSPEKNTKLIK